VAVGDLMLQIREQYAADEAEAAAGKRAVDPSDIPFSYETITPEWLTHLLCKEHPQARVVGFTLDEKDDGTANRQRIFLTYNEAGRAAGLPASVFCKASQGLLNRINLGLSGGTHSEVTFYNRLRPHLVLDIPIPYLATYDPKSFNSIIVMKDLEKEVSFCRHWTPISFELALSQMDLLAGVHSRFQDSPVFNAQSTGLVTWPQFFAAVVSYGHETATNNGFLAAEAVIPPRLFRRYDEVWPAICYGVKTHERLPATLVHGDCHLKQWFIRSSNNRMGLTDWQCASFGHWARDVAYVIATSLTVEDRRRWEKDLVTYYLGQMAEKGAAMPSFDEAWLRYRQNMVSALSWWTGTLTPTDDQPDMQPRETSLEFIKRLSHGIDDLDGLDACQGA
jgi:hypothetical protein